MTVPLIISGVLGVLLLGLGIAPHGAALTNLLFAPPHCRVLELFPSKYRYPQFKSLSRTLRLPYQSHLSPTAANDPDDDPDDDLHLPTLVPVLDRLLAGP